MEVFQRIRKRAKDGEHAFSEKTLNMHDANAERDTLYCNTNSHYSHSNLTTNQIITKRISCTAHSQPEMNDNNNNRQNLDRKSRETTFIITQGSHYYRRTRSLPDNPRRKVSGRTDQNKSSIMYGKTM